MRDRLVAVDLIAKREAVRLGPWLERYIKSRTDLKPASITKLEQTKEELLAHFDSTTPLRKITRSDAADWRQWLVDQKLREATVRQHCRNAKTFFNEAVERDLLAKSPVRNLKSGIIAATNDRYITPEEADKILDACPNLQWRILFGLARLAGLRTPSETYLLTWGDVDWERGRLIVRSPKTEHHAGKEQRIVPITPRLMTILQDAFDQAEPGQDRIITRSPNNPHREFNGIIEKAGLQKWDNAFQTLRRSCEIE